MTDTTSASTGDHVAMPHVWRVLTWNVRGSHRPDLGSIAEVLDGYAPDVVALQEVQRAQARGLALRLGWRVRWARKHYPWTPLLWWRAEGHALLTRHALEDTVVRTVSPGVSTWTYRHRILLSGTVRRDDGSIRVHDTHLAAHREPDERIAQARRVARFVTDDGPAVHVVAGDLNAHEEVEVTRELRAVGLIDPGGDATHPAVMPRRRFDYVLVPQGSTVVQRHRPSGGEEWAELSDHLPAVVAFRCPPREAPPV